MIKLAKLSSQEPINRANNSLAILVIYLMAVEIFSLSYLQEGAARGRDKMLKQRFQFHFAMLYLAKR